MLIPIAIIIFASCIVLFSGNNTNAEQLYYDADFSELYKADGSSGTNEDNESIEVSEEIPEPPNIRRRRHRVSEPEDKIEPDMSALDGLDAAAIAKDVYSSSDL